MPTAFEAIEGWIAEARAKLENGGIQKGDLDQLHQIINANRRGTRQRLLYLHAATPSIRSQVIGMALQRTGARFSDGDYDRGAGVAL